MKIMSIVGARPQFVKLAPVDKALRARGFVHLIVHTGQHYDPVMSQSFFDDLAIEAPFANLGVGSGSHAVQTAAVMTGLDRILMEQQPDWVVVYGDTNTTLGGTLAASQAGMRLAHLEAGLRSGDRSMPEERNRVVADHLADLLLAPTPEAVCNLDREGLQARALLVGDVMVDALESIRARVLSDPGRYLPKYLGEGPFLLATLHRQDLTADPDRLAATLKALACSSLPVWLLAHPRLRRRAAELDLPLSMGALRASEPLPYPSMVAALIAAEGLVTDSGGLQKEALLLGVPCTTLRSRTEWPETLQDGWNVLVPEPAQILAAVTRSRPTTPAPRPYGDGTAAERVAEALGTTRLP